VEEDENPVAGKLFNGHVFDLTEMLRQYIVLDEPTQPLPPLLKNGHCAHCHRLPEDVLRIVTEDTSFEEATEQTPINPAFAKLSQLLNTEEK